MAIFYDKIWMTRNHIMWQTERKFIDMILSNQINQIYNDHLMSWDYAVTRIVDIAPGTLPCRFCEGKF